MPADEPTVVGRLRKASITAADSLLNFNPQPGMWAATGTAIAYAPTLTELREPIAGGENIQFNEHGHSARAVVADDDGEHTLTHMLSQTATRVPTVVEGEKGDEPVRPQPIRRPTLAAQAESQEKHSWKEATKHGFTAAWKFVSTPTGFLMTVYGLNVVAWGAMLFFLLLGAAPAMNHPSKDDNSSPRKIWLEIDSQILNALFCVTGFGLAPWRFRDLYWLTKAGMSKNRHAMKRLSEQNKSWFRPPMWYQEGAQDADEGTKGNLTFTGEVAPPTSMWKLAFVVWMMVLNTLLQAVLCYFMWGYNRINRPTWATGTFIALGCGVAMFAGIMSWWEGRKVKKIEGPMLKVVDAEKDGNSEKTPVVV